jgi:sucrose phosphorylase
LERIAPLIRQYIPRKSGKAEFFSQSDVVLITYGDTLRKPGEPPLVTLYDFATVHLKDTVSTIHFLTSMSGWNRSNTHGKKPVYCVG